MDGTKPECKRCGRELKDKKSIERGYGPACYEKMLRDKYGPLEAEESN